MAIETLRPTSTSDGSFNVAGTGSWSNTNLANAYDGNSSTFATQQVTAQARSGTDTRSDSIIKYLFPAKAQTWTAWTLNVVIDWSSVAGSGSDSPFAGVYLDLWDSGGVQKGSTSTNTGTSQAKTTIQISGSGDIPNFNGGWCQIKVRAQTQAPDGTARQWTVNPYEVWIDGTYTDSNPGAFFAFF